MRNRSALVSILWFCGLGSVFVGERLIGAGSLRWLSALGVFLAVLAPTLRAIRRRHSDPERRTVESLLLGLEALGVVALALYFLQSDLSGAVLDKTLDRGWPKLAVALGALYPALLLASTLPVLLVELAYASVARAPRLELGRIRDAALSGLGLAGALVFAFSAAYVATVRDKKVDLSYFRTARPGESTRKIVRTLDQPVQVNLFFPPSNEVHEEVAGYFADLAAESKLIEVKNYDFAVDPQKAKELGVSGNGIVQVARGTRRESLSIGLELESARTQLGNLDREVQKRLLQVARPQRTVYLTVGHGERTAEASGDTDKRGTIRELRDLMFQQGYTVKNLGAAEGLANDVPSDAAAVLLIGPQKPLLGEESAALVRYVDRGGRLFVALDPESGLDEKELLGPLGVKYQTATLANDQIYAKRGYQQSDRANIVTGSFSSHPSVTALGKLGMRAPMVLFRSGWLEEEKGHSRELTVFFTVHAMPSTWNDLDGNYAFDSPPEQRKAWELAAAILRKKSDSKSTADEGRALVLADSDALADGVIGNPGNAYFVLDGMKWLLGDEAITGEIASEIDVPITHTKKQDAAWFYLTIFLAPALTLGVGWLATRRRRRRRPDRTSDAAPGVKEAA